MRTHGAASTESDAEADCAETPADEPVADIASVELEGACV